MWLKTASGPVNIIISEQLALFFVDKADQEQTQHVLQSGGINVAKISLLALKTFGQQQVCGFYFKTLRAFYQSKKLLKHHNIACYEDDFRPEERFLTERFITAWLEFSPPTSTVTKPLTTKLCHDFPVFYTNQCRPCLPTLHSRASSEKTYSSLDMVSLDIECSMQGQLYSIGLYSKKLNNKPCQCILMIGDPANTAGPTSLTEEECAIAENIIWLADEKALLYALIAWLRQYDPDIIIGWNVINFDFRLLQKRCDIHQIDFAIGRDGKVPRWRQNNSQSGDDNSEQSEQSLLTSGQHFIEISGRVILDGIDLLKTATYHFSRFTLDHVAHSLLGIGKKVNNVEHRGQEITDNFHHDKLALAAYNIEDCRLVSLIFEKKQLLKFAMLRAQLTGLTINRMGGSVAAFTNLYLPKLHRSGYVAPNIGDGMQGLVAPGGYVMDSLPGLYQNILVLDFKSLYPSIIRSFKIDPMGLIEGLKNPSHAIAGFDGAYFSREQHFLPDMITTLWAERDKAKRDKDNALSQAIKIIMNSFYGILGSTGCRFFDPRLSGAITKRSHEILKTTKLWIEAKGYQVIYGDTDSIFVAAGKDKSLVQSRALGHELALFINDKWRKNLAERFTIDSHLEIEFECHFSQFFMPAVRGQLPQHSTTLTPDPIAYVGTKKRYVGQIENGNIKEIVFKGLETVRSDWTLLAKHFQRALYQRVFAKQSMKAIEGYIREVVKNTLLGEFDHQLIYRKRLRRKLKDYVKTAPPHVKAARFADQQNQSQGQPLNYQDKGWIEYIMTINGPQTLAHQTASIDYQHYIDKQLQSVADDILPFLGSNFVKITAQQLPLF